MLKVVDFFATNVMLCNDILIRNLSAIFQY